MNRKSKEKSITIEVRFSLNYFFEKMKIIKIYFRKDRVKIV